MYLGSTRHGAIHLASDYDLLVVLSEMPVPLKVLLTTVDGRLADVLFAQVAFAYFLVRRLPWTGETAAVEHGARHDPEYLRRFDAYHVTSDLQERFACYTELAQRALEPVGGLSPRDAVNAIREGDSWDLRDLAAAVGFWHGLPD